MNRSRLFAALFVLLLGSVPVMAQSFRIAPSAPSVGDKITVTYNTSPSDCPLKGEADLKAEALFMHDTEMPALVAVPLTKSGEDWTGSFVLSDKDARLVLFRVVAGGKQDNNNGNAWSTFVYDKNGKPVQNANVVYASFLSSGGFMEFKHAKDPASALVAIGEEKRLFPSNWRAYLQEGRLQMRQKGASMNPADFAAAAESYCRRFAENEEAMADGLNWLEQTGQKVRADSLRKSFMKKNPRGPVAEAEQLKAVFMEQEPAKQADLAEKFLVKFPQKPAMQSKLQGLLFNDLVKTQQFDRAIKVIDGAPSLQMYAYNSIAWNWINGGVNLEKAVPLAAKGVEVARTPPAGARPTYINDADWEQTRTEALSMVLDTYGFGLYKLERYAEAEDALAEAYRGSKGEDGGVMERLVATYNARGKYAEALNLGQKAVETSKTTPALMEHLKAAYVKSKGSESGYDALIAGWKEKALKTAKEGLQKERIGQPAPMFGLKATDGSTVSLESLKGKVVVVDFWATWCGPCKMSLPTLQKVYEKYAPNKDVVVLALDTWERVSGTERERLVTDFLTQNKYTFTVLFDQDMVEKYGVEGIPTKFVIDKKGNIAFKSVGFDNEDEMMTHLTLQIDCLLAE